MSGQGRGKTVNATSTIYQTITSAQAQTPYGGKIKWYTVTFAAWYYYKRAPETTTQINRHPAHTHTPHTEAEYWERLVFIIHGRQQVAKLLFIPGLYSNCPLSIPLLRSICPLKEHYAAQHCTLITDSRDQTLGWQAAAWAACRTATGSSSALAWGEMGFTEMEKVKVILRKVEKCADRRAVTQQMMKNLMLGSIKINKTQHQILSAWRQGTEASRFLNQVQTQNSAAGGLSAPQEEKTLYRENNSKNRGRTKSEQSGQKDYDGRKEWRKKGK